jgi:hypothetical protein
MVDKLRSFLASTLHGVDFSASRTGRCTSAEELPIPAKLSVEWASEAVWTLRIRKQTLALAGT